MVCVNFSAIEKPLTVVIDAGHGGNDKGAILNDISEKEIVYAISQKIKALENENIEIILLRRDNHFLSLQDRVNKINTISPDLVLSLHLDKSKSEDLQSTEAYIYDNENLRSSYYYATKLLNSINAHQEDEENIKFAGFYLLKQSKVPAVNLHLGNLNNEEDFTFLNSELGQNHVAKQIINALQ